MGRTAPTTSRLTRQRSTLGRTMTLGLTDSATSKAAGSAACAMALPIVPGIGIKDTCGKKVNVLKSNSPQTTPTLTRTERSRRSPACA